MQQIFKELYKLGFSRDDVIDFIAIFWKDLRTHKSICTANKRFNP